MKGCGSEVPEKGLRRGVKSPGTQPGRRALGFCSRGTSGQLRCFAAHSSSVVAGPILDQSQLCGGACPEGRGQGLSNS